MNRGIQWQSGLQVVPKLIPRGEINIKTETEDRGKNAVTQMQHTDQKLGCEYPL